MTPKVMRHVGLEVVGIVVGIKSFKFSTDRSSTVTYLSILLRKAALQLHETLRFLSACLRGRRTGGAERKGVSPKFRRRAQCISCEAEYLAKAGSVSVISRGVSKKREQKTLAIVNCRILWKNCDLLLTVSLPYSGLTLALMGLWISHQLMGEGC